MAVKITLIITDMNSVYKQPMEKIRGSLLQRFAGGT